MRRPGSASGSPRRFCRPRAASPRRSQRCCHCSTCTACRRALEQFLGSSAGLSPATVTRLTAQWQADHTAFMDRDLSATDYVYVWADGVHLRIRLEEAKAAVLV